MKQNKTNLKNIHASVFTECKATCVRMNVRIPLEHLKLISKAIISLQKINLFTNSFDQYVCIVY